MLVACRTGNVWTRPGAGVARQHGTVQQLNISSGGVPKHAVAAAALGHRGFEGDRQRSRKHHGRAFQAVCLWSADVIDRLRNAGHPVFPCAAGENVTVAGLDCVGDPIEVEPDVATARS